MPCCTGKNKGDTVKETLNKARLTALHAICVQIFRHIALGNLPKNLTTHLTHKLYSVFPK